MNYSYIYLAHPQSVTSFTWRTHSKYMPRGSVCNMLVSSCRDNICRVWVETVLPDDGSLAMVHIDPQAQNPHFRTHRHKQKFLTRLKHMKSRFGSHNKKDHNASLNDESMGNISNSENNNVEVITNGESIKEPIQGLPHVFSTHDVSSYGYHAMGVTAGYHFHLAASINAATDIPLVPCLSTPRSSNNNNNFVLHWLNNKEMTFTQQAEKMLLEVSKRALDKENNNQHKHAEDRANCLNKDASNGTLEPGEDVLSVSSGNSKGLGAGRGSVGGRSMEQQHEDVSSHRILSAATSSTSIATDVTSAPGELGGSLNTGLVLTIILLE